MKISVRSSVFFPVWGRGRPETEVWLPIPNNSQICMQWGLDYSCNDFLLKLVDWYQSFLDFLTRELKAISSIPCICLKNTALPIPLLSAEISNTAPKEPSPLSLKVLRIAEHKVYHQIEGYFFCFCFSSCFFVFPMWVRVNPKLQNAKKRHCSLFVTESRNLLLLEAETLNSNNKLLLFVVLSNVVQNITATGWTSCKSHLISNATLPVDTDRKTREYLFASSWFFLWLCCLLLDILGQELLLHWRSELLQALLQHW